MRTQTWDKEIINYARDLMDQGFSDGQINLLMEQKYNKKANEKVLLNWFMIGRRDEDIPRNADRAFECKYKDATDFKTRITNIKTRVQTGKTVAFIVKEYQDDDLLVKKKVKAKVIQPYRHFILTERGTVDYDEVLEVIG